MDAIALLKDDHAKAKKLRAEHREASKAELLTDAMPERDQVER